MSEPIHDRKNTHGPYKTQFRVSQELKQVVHRNAGGLRFDPVHIEALDMICMKMSRILTGDPTFADHWEDIAGYAMRVVGK
jgi:Domain of unknown function (DUF6378)